jgi:uncharacterized protein
MTTKKRVTVRNSETFRMKSKYVKDTFKIDVQLPRSYATSDQTYPTVYFTDGDDAFDLASGILQMLAMDRAIPEMILVGIGYGADSFDMVNNHRNRDYPPTQTEVLTAPGVPAIPPIGGGAPDFLRFIRAELMPRIETSYRSNPAQRVFSGVSFGGLFGTYVLFHQPDTFSRYLISSPSLYWDNRVSLAFEQAYAQSNADLAARVYFSVGTWEEPNLLSPESSHPLRPLTDWELANFASAQQVTNMRALVACLRSRGYPNLRFTCREEEGGHTSSQPGAITKGLMWLFQ